MVNTVRFKIRWQGKIRVVRLKEGEKVEFFSHSRTEEGWSSEAVSLFLEGDTISRFYHADGVDCDGRLQTSTESYTTKDKLRAVEYEGHFFPEWISKRSSQRDFQAEAAGY